MIFISLFSRFVDGSFLNALVLPRAGQGFQAVPSLITMLVMTVTTAFRRVRGVSLRAWLVLVLAPALTISASSILFRLLPDRCHCQIF